MSEFNHYARELNELATDNFENYNKALIAYNEAAEAVKAPKRVTMYDGFSATAAAAEKAQEAAREAKLKAELATAEMKLHEAEEKLQSGNRDITAIRDALTKSINSKYSAKSEDVDSNVISLLDSDIMSVDEFVQLFNKAVQAENYTTARLIAAKAEKKREENPAFALIASKGKALNGSQYLELFDNLSEVYLRCSNTPSMIGYWEQLTKRMIDEF
jgi:hypothetical protein